MNRFVTGAAFAVASLMATTAFAQTTVNFDQSTDTGFYRSQGLVLNGFTISSNTFGGAVNVPSQPNYASVNASGSTISFVDRTTGLATTSNGFGLTIPGLNAGGGYYAGGTLDFFGTTGNLLGTQFFAPVGPNEFRGNIQYANSLQNIASVVFTRAENPQGPALFPLDDVTFSLNAVAGGVPEPASWAMMIGGFGLVGGAMRRQVRSTKVRFAA